MNKKTHATRILCILLSMVMVISGVTGCDNSKPSSEKGDSSVSETASGSSAESTGEVTSDGVLLDYGSGAIQVDENGELPVKELKFDSLGAEIDGEIKAEDVTLSGAFADMKVDSVSNDSSSVTVTLSGSPDLKRETYAVPLTGKVEVAASYFGTDAPAHGSIRMNEYHKKQDSTEPVFWPYFDSIIEGEDGGKDAVNIKLLAESGDFAKGFSKKDISLGLDFADGKITKFKKSDSGYDVTVAATRGKDKSDAKDTYSYYGTLILAAGSMVGTDGKEYQDKLTITREYSQETLGRDLSGKDIDEIKDIVGGFGNTTFGTITDLVSGGISVGTGIYTVLGWCGVFPTDASRHAEIMNKLSELQDQISDVNENVNYCRQVLDQHTTMLRSLGIKIDTYYLNGFNSDMNTMKSTMTDIDKALKKNHDKIEELVGTYEDENGEDTVLDEEEFYDALYEVGGDIMDLKFSNSTTIGSLISDLRHQFDKVAGYFENVDDGSNPINAFCNMHNDLDNFSTTSLDEKKLYAAEIEYQLNRAVLLMSALDGYEETETKRDKLDSCIFPEVEVKNETYKEVGKEKYPKCYLMDSFVCISGDVYNEIGEPMRNQQIKEKYFLSNADAADFAKRMNGRTLEEELRLAKVPGIDEAMNTQTRFPDIATVQYSYPNNKNYMGIAFSYERWGLSWGKKTGYYEHAGDYFLNGIRHKVDDYYEFDIEVIGASDIGNEGLNHQYFRSPVDGAGKNAWWIVCPSGILWGQTGINRRGLSKSEYGKDGMIFAMWNSEYNQKSGFSFGNTFPMLHFVAK